MDTSKIKEDIKRLTEKLGQLDSVSQHLNSYEKRVRGIVKDFDVRGREAREKSLEQIGKFTSQMKKTKLELEKQFKSLVHQEGKKINASLSELFAYLKSLAGQEKDGGVKKPKPRSVSSAKSRTKATTKNSAAAKKTVGKRRSPTRKENSAPEAAPSH